MSSRRAPRADTSAPTSANASVAPTPNRPPPSIAASERSSMSSDGDDSDLISDTLSEADSKRRNERPRFDSSVSYADSTRLDRFDSRASMLSNRERSDSRASSSSRASISSRRSARASELRTTTAKTPDLDAIDEEDYQFVSPFADFDAHDQPIREQLQKGLEIVNEHTSKLKEIEDALSAAMSEVWGYWADPIQLHLHPAERVDVQDLIRTDNELFNKVLTVFAVLCDEISELKVTVEDNFYPALIMFGQAKHGDKGDVKPGEDEVHIGRMLPFFQDISNFVDRCNSIATNLVHQLASLYQSFQKLWKSTFKHVHLTTVFDAFGHVLEILLTLDLIVMDNPNIVTSWDKYKRMMQYVRADPARYNVTADQVKAFERLLVNLDGTFMGKKGLWQLQLKVPVVVLCGRLSWYLPEFLIKYAPLQSKTAVPVDVVQARRDYLGNLIVKGLILAKRVQTMMQTLLQLHLQLNIPMPKRILRPLYHCVEMNKAIEFMLARKNPILGESAALMLRQVAHALTLLLRPIKAKLEASKRFDDTKLDILAAVSVVEDILHTGESFSSTRLTVLSLAIQIALISDDEPKDKKTITPSGEAEARKLVWKLHVLCDFQRKIRLATDCSFLYWSRELLTLFVQDMYSVPENANAIKVLKTAGHEENAVAYYVEAFASFVEEVVEDDLVVPLCMDIENDLRLHVHSVHLEHMETPNPINNADFKVLHYYMDLRPIRIWGKCVDLRDRVTHYLESTFYNLTTVALHDWKTYVCGFV
ncbi:hypothetical protein DYB25_009324 [Aphanomyces astaci]|uniref:WASH complex subunit 4 N-terminal domain-containing protein n=1 Tax=Aphanomyces astaci TaxID=112090 RepID=A0A397AQV4_APHAT|nr:hypothetical protein DYB25_009324 [Aphanomyces astaci]